MSENDYIAEYIREKRPEILSSLDYIAWRITKAVDYSVNAIVKAFNEYTDEKGVKK